MAFFRDRAVNLLNLHYGIHSIALSGAGAFFAVYPLKAGVSLPWVLASLSLILAGRLLIRPVVVPIAVHSGFARACHRRHLPHRAAIPAACGGARGGCGLVRFMRGGLARGHFLLVGLSRLFRRARQS